MTTHDDYAGLTQEELDELAAESEQRPSEDASTWQARAALLAANAKAAAAARRSADEEAAAALGPQAEATPAEPAPGA